MNKKVISLCLFASAKLRGFVSFNSRIILVICGTQMQVCSPDVSMIFNTVRSKMTLLPRPRRGGGAALRVALIIGVVAAVLLSMTVVEARGGRGRGGRSRGSRGSWRHSRNRYVSRSKIILITSF